MRRSKFKVRTLVFSLAVAATVLSPFSMKAQGGGADGLFKGGSEVYENREGDDLSVSGGITNDSFNAPLGNGMIVMMAAGLGYAAAKRQKVKGGER